MESMVGGGAAPIHGRHHYMQQDAAGRRGRSQHINMSPAKNQVYGASLPDDLIEISEEGAIDIVKTRRAMTRKSNSYSCGL